MMQVPDWDFEAGEVLLVDKPLKWTSFDVVNKVRYAIGRKTKVGHAGTLDPLATGLLVLCTGKKTKTIETLMATEKSYKGTLMVGAITPSYDGETQPENFKDFSFITETHLREAEKAFSGLISQRPPDFSAIKVGGVKLYEAARQGQTIEAPSRQVEIKSLTLKITQLPEIEFEAVVSKGTYIRSLVHDIGALWGCGAWMNSLVRTGSGELNLGDAYALPDLIEKIGIWKKLKVSEQE